MKIEIGESLVYSWLRHVKKCQVVQMNWKPSPKWHTNDKDFQILKTEITNVFKYYQIDIFKKTSSLDQFFQQAEIDVVGITQHNNEPTIYLVDVAFHENGLNYGSKAETIARVLKKYIRSYFIYLRYFNNFTKGIIYFVTPRMSSDNIYKPLMDEINRLKECLKKFNYTPDFQLLANDHFEKEVLTPTMALCNEIADTNELFLRSAQLWRLFECETKPHEGKHHSIDQTTIIEGKKTPGETKPQIIGKTLPSEKMDDSQLNSSLKTIGKTCFVEYYEKFQAVDEYTSHQLVELLMEEQGYKKTSASTKVSQSRKIFKAGCEQKALEVIINSKILEDTVKEKAKVLLDKHHK